MPRRVAFGFLICTLVSCESSAVTPPPPVACVAAAPAVSFFDDVGNTGSGADIRIRLVPPASTECTAEMRLIVVDASATLGLEQALQVPLDRVRRLTPGFTERELDWAAPGVDAAGIPLAEGTTYRLHLLAVGVGETPSRIVTFPTAATLANVDAVVTISPVISAGSGGLETDPEGNIYTADFGQTLSGPPGTVIHRVSPDGDVDVFARGFLGASGNDRAQNGDLFQSSIQGGTIHRVTPDGEVTLWASGISGPVGIHALPGDTLLVAGCSDNTIRRVEPDRTVTTVSASSLLTCPNGITRADDGNVYIANFSDGWVLRMTPDGAVSRVARVPSNNAGHLLWGSGALWVVDRGGHRLYRLPLGGDLTPVAGTGVRGLRDGPADRATLSLTNDVAFSPSGDRLYFNDVAAESGDQAVIAPVVIRALVFAR